VLKKYKALWLTVGGPGVLLRVIEDFGGPTSDI
jgi:hypothetical protein